MSRSEYVSPDAWRALFASMEYDNAVALRVSMETGLRIGDVLGLRPDALQGDRLSAVSAKTGKSGTYTLSRKTADRVRHCIGRWWMFPGRDPQKHRTRQAVYKDLRNACKHAHVPGHISPHSARKTYAVHVYREKGLKAVKKALQHDSDVTSMLYAFSDKITARENSVRELESGDEIAEKIAKLVVSLLQADEKKGG